MEIFIDCENNYSGWNIDLEAVKRNAARIFEFFMNDKEICVNSALKDYNYTAVSFDFLFCSKVQIQQINKEYRNKDYPADIITFAVFADSTEDEKFMLDGEINLGEIIIAPDKIIENAKEKNLPKETELAFFISHGIMHLLGFDHQTEKDYNFVVSKQIAALESISIKYDKV